MHGEKRKPVHSSIHQIIAIKDLKCYTFDIYNLHSSLTRCSDTELSYSIEDADGYDYGGRIPIEALDLYMDGRVDEARARLGR